MKRVIRLLTFGIATFVLTAFSVSSTQAESLAMREIRVAAAVSPGFQSLPEWKSDFERRLIYASRIFESEFKIKFKLVRYVKWTPSEEAAEMTSLLEQLRGDINLADVDIVIGLTHYNVAPDHPDMKDLHTLGQARPFSGHLVIRYPANKLYKVQEETVLAHELGHVFGAVHTDDPNSIMSPVVDRQIPVRFDAENRQIILETRAINVNRGAESLPTNMLQRLLRSYLKMIGKNGSSDFYYSIGLFYLQLGQPNDAIKAWKRAVSVDPENPEWRYNLGALYFKSGDFAHAIPELSQAVSGFRFDVQKPMQASALTILGEAYFEQDNMFAANNAWTRALGLQPGDLELQAGLAGVKFKQGQISNAIDDFQRILKKDPKNLRSLIYLGKALHQQQKMPEAVQYFELALTELNRQPRTPGQVQQLSTVYGELGNIYLTLDNQKQAFENFQAACDLAPSGECHKQLGVTMFSMRQWGEASREFAQALQFNKEDADVYGMMGTALAQNDDFPNAVGVFKEGLKYAKDPKMQARLHRNIGNLYLSQKGYDLAEPEFQLALTKDWSDVDSHFGLAMAQLGKDESVSAIDSLRDVLRIDPSNKRAQSMLESIQASLNSQQPG